MNHRPGNLSTMMLTLAEWMDIADSAFERLDAYEGATGITRGDAVQQDLRSLADWFYHHPGADEEIYREVFGETEAP